MATNTVIIADKETLDSVDSKIDSLTTTAETTLSYSVMTNDYTGALMQMVGTTYTGDTAIDEMINSLANSVSTLSAAVASLQTTVESIEGGVSSCIRHIQRGTTSINSTTSVSIDLNGFTNLNHMIVLLDGYTFYRIAGSSSYYCSQIPYVSTLTTSSLTIGSHYGDSDYTISYQVIEFY